MDGALELNPSANFDWLWCLLEDSTGAPLFTSEAHTDDGQTLTEPPDWHRGQEYRRLTVAGQGSRVSADPVQGPKW